MLFKRKATILALLLVIPVLLFAFGTQEQEAQQPAEEAEQPAAQAEQPAEQAQQPAEQQMAAANVRLQEAIGMTAASQDGSVQGTIQDFVFSSDGSISHVAISFQPAGAAAPAEQAPAEQPAEQAPAEQPMAAGEIRLVTADKVTFEAQQAVLQVTQDEIQGLPTMQAGSLPQDLAGQNMVLGSQLSNWSVVGQNGEELGQVADAMLNLSDKRWEYLAVTPAGVLGLAEQYYAVPADAVSQIDPAQSRITLNVTPDQFGQYQGFGEANWPQQAGAAAAPTEQPAPTEQQAPAEQAPTEQQ